MTSPITASFNVETGLEDQKVIPIGGPSVIAGNSDAVDLRIDNRFVSRRHFQVRLETDVFYNIRPREYQRHLSQRHQITPSRRTYPS